MPVYNKKPSIVYCLDNKLYLNITNKCSNNCYFCFRKFKTGIQDFNLKLKKEPTIEEVKKEIRKFINRKNWREIVFCGFGEPIGKLNLVLEVTKWIKKNYWKTVRIDTNGQGYLLNKGRNVVQELKQARLDKLNISLNAQNKEVYNNICKPFYENAYESILDFIKKADKVGIETVVTAVSLPEIDIFKIKELVQKMNVKFVLREYIPFFW
jgi:cyclic pyranopterin phosphate synthase